uniref:Putative conserved secreted protein n=1 Tax=Culex tarsalis TaxID=7177 RepID=A0A1Q3FZ76_CULTA
MYPPTIVVLALALVSCGSRQVLSLETLLRLEQSDGDGEGGLGDLGSSSTFEDTSYDTDSEDNASSSYPQQPPAVPLDGVFYRVTPASDADSQERTLVASPTSSTTGNSILLPEEEDASVEDQQVTDKIAGVAQPFIGGTSEDDLHDTASRSRSLDHEPSPIDTLQSPSTVLETSLSTNYLYTSSGTGSSSFFNDTYHHSTTSDTSSSSAELDASLDVSSSEDQSTTTNLPPLSIGPDDVIIPKPTKPHLDESKISKAELLSLLIADKNLRLPIAILVDTCNDSLSYSKKVFDAALVPRSPLEVILMRYNATGIAKSTSFRNTKSLMDSINALQPSYDGSGRAYYGILRTSQEIPYDSAIFLATSNPATDKELAKMAALTLLKKRIRLYVIWFGDEVDMNLSDQHLDSQTGLHELAFKTGGRVIRFEIDRNFGNNPVLTTLVSESELRGDTSIPIPVPEDVNSLYFKLHGALDAATLRTPNGD